MFMLSMRCQLVGAVLVTACGPSVGTGGSAPGSSEVTGASASGSSGATATSGADTMADVTGAPPLPSTCPEDANLASGECPAQGTACEYGDLTCDCVCGCESPVPGDAGIYQCDYARPDAWALTEAVVRLDCGAQTIRSSLTATLDNTDGASPVSFGLDTPFGYFMTPAVEGPEMICGGLCPTQELCPEYGPFDVEFGATEARDLEFIPLPCDELATQCADFCSGTADFTVYAWIEVAGVTAPLGPIFMTDVPIECD